MQGMAMAIQHTSLPVIVQSDSREALYINLNMDWFGSLGIWTIGYEDDACKKTYILNSPPHGRMINAESLV